MTRCEPRTSCERRAQVVGRDVLRAQQGPGGRALLLGHREQQVLGGDVGVAQLLGLRVGPIEDAAAARG